jgi:DNA polymerase elongation subunit (family B)
MDEVEKMLEDIYQQRLIDKKVLHHTKPKAHKSGGYKAHINFDFASLYPSTQKSYKIHPEIISVRRRISIKKIFNESVEI